MGLLRTILSLVILLIFIHIALFALGIERSTNVLTETVYSLGLLVESPATIIFGLLGSSRPNFMDPSSFFVTALTAAAAYFILYLLLGIGRD